MFLFFVFFFFSSRRRHTRCSRDWSSDVCSSDLQKQRVAIARALAMEPRGLLCDEITSALDPELKCEVLSVLEDLKKDGMTLLMVTHEIGFARRAADRVVVLADGKLIENGTPAEVLDAPRHERVRAFLRRVLG